MTDKGDNIIPLPKAEDIEVQAAEWLVVLGRSSVTLEEKLELKQWLSTSDRHREIFDEMAAMWDDMAILKELDDIGEAASTISYQKPTMTISRRGIFGAIAAMLGVAALAGATWEYYTYQSLFQEAVYTTEVGEQHKVVLSDGSTLRVNTDSKVNIEFTPEKRFIHLARGEAHFEVAKDKSRPFYVKAGGGVVRAVGTAFSVRVRPNNSVEVIVEEGRVALSSVPQKAEGSVSQDVTLESMNDVLDTAPSLAELTAGQSAVFADKIEAFIEIQQPEMQRKLSWRQGLLAYAGDPLSDVVADVSRYTDMTIEIVETDLKDMPIGGYFKVGETRALLESLEGTFGLHVEYINETYVKITR